MQQMLVSNIFHAASTADCRQEFVTVYEPADIQRKTCLLTMDDYASQALTKAMKVERVNCTVLPDARI